MVTTMSNRTKRSQTRSLVAALLLLPLSLALAGQNTIGRQSQNEGILAVPAPPQVKVDGDLAEWDWSGRIWCFADWQMRQRYSVEAAAMWDKDNLYLAAKWKDPLPLNSTIDPALNPNEGWKADSWQMRVHSDRNLWITVWYFATGKQAVMDFAYWQDDRDNKRGIDNLRFVGAPGATDLGRGVQMAYRLDADDKGFSQEMCIPWKLLWRTVPEIRPGLALRMGSEFLWGDPTGKTWPIHRYADNMQPGKTSREFYWTAVDSWGDIRLSDKGQLPVREYVVDGQRVEGTVPVQVQIPQNAARFTLLLDDDTGKPVRTLAADADPADYATPGKSADDLQTVEVKWDCRDDYGKLIEPGTYRLRGLTHTGIAANYEMCFYNPGTPPWPTSDDSGAWGADHTGPIAVTAAGDWTFVAFPVVEGGSGVIGINPEGRKRWADRRGITKLAGDEACVYAYVTAWYTKETICRYDRKTGKPRAFVLDGKERTFDLPLTEILGEEKPGKVTGMAAHNGVLVLGLDSGRIVLLDATSAKVAKSFPAAGVSEVAVSRDGKLYALLEGKVSAIDTETGAATEIPTPGVGQAVALAVDLDGNVLVADIGPDSQVKAFSPGGKPAYTCGRKGGRPLVGDFDDQAMVKMSSVAVDAKGQVWVVEKWDMPRRVSVWGRDGHLVRDYIGNTCYAGASCFLHDQDPTLAYVGPIELKLDKAKNCWKVTRILWLPDDPEKQNEFVHNNGNCQRFRSAAGGAEHEYFYLHETDLERGTGHIVIMERDGRFQPVAAIALAGHLSGRITRRNGLVEEQPFGELAGLNAYDAVIWNDGNGDGRIQRPECTIVKTDKPGDEDKRGVPALDLSNGWGGRMGDDLSIYTDGLTRWKPLRYEKGAPVYGLEGKTQLARQERGTDLVPVPGEDRLICLTWNTRPMPQLVMLDLKQDKVEWTYPNPYPGVHGSHRATMPRPGLLIGPLKTCGVARISDQAGSVFLMRGNLGQDFLFTTDGVFVGTLFQDTRLPNEGLPDREEKLRGMPLDGLTEGGEPFNGWFGRQTDGKVRLITGMPRQASMILEIKGLESIRRYAGGTFAVSQAQIVQADADNRARAAKTAEPKQYKIVRLPAAPKLDGGAAGWKDVPPLKIEREGLPDRAVAKIAYDGTRLHLRIEVQDATPWKNAGKDLGRLFKTGDAVDLQLGVGPAEAKPHREPKAGDLRVVLAQLEGKPVAVLMVPVDKSAPATARKSYTSPVGTKVFDRVEVLADAQVTVKVQGQQRYAIEAALPLSALGLTLTPGLALRGDLGFISSDAQGMINTARTYWANPHTNLVNDEPLEAWLYPDAWGQFTFE